MFDRVCREHGIEHRLTKPYHPWTNGQAERMNRTIKDATVKAFHYENLESLKAHAAVTPSRTATGPQIMPISAVSAAGLFRSALNFAISSALVMSVSS